MTEKKSSSTGPISVMILHSIRKLALRAALVKATGSFLIFPILQPRLELTPLRIRTLPTGTRLLLTTKEIRYCLPMSGAEDRSPNAVQMIPWSGEQTQYFQSMEVKWISRATLSFRRLKHLRRTV